MNQTQPLSHCCKAPVKLNVLTNEYMKHHSDICTSCGFPCTLAEPTTTSVRENELREKIEEMARTLWRKREYECEIDAEEGLVKFIESILHSELERKVANIRNRVDNVLSSKYEGIARIDSELDRMIMNCISTEEDTALSGKFNQE